MFFCVIFGPVLEGFLSFAPSFAPSFVPSYVPSFVPDSGISAQIRKGQEKRTQNITFFDRKRSNSSGLYPCPHSLAQVQKLHKKTLRFMSGIDQTQVHFYPPPHSLVQVHKVLSPRGPKIA